MAQIDSIDKLIQIIQSRDLKEHLFENVELKSSWQLDHGKKICAFANIINQKNSWLIVGINDEGILLGNSEKWAKENQVVIAQQVNEHLNPTQAVRSITCHEINSYWILIIHIVPPGALTQWKKQSYKIVGTSCTQMTPEETMQLVVSLPGLEDYSAQSTESELDLTLIKNFASHICLQRNEAQFSDLTNCSPEDVLKRIGLLNKRTADILFGKYKFRVVIYTASGEPVYNSTENSLIKLLSLNFIDLIKKHSGQYSTKALKEALANTVAHTAYFDKQGDVLIEIFPNKLIISNLCLPEAAHFANKWFSRSRNTTNILLMETLRLAKHVDELGRGKNLIFSECIKGGQKPPNVSIEPAGQFSRWRLYLYAYSDDPIQTKIFNRLKTLYKDDFKALVAYALVLWRNVPVSHISKYIDGESEQYFVEILQDLNGPVFFYEKEDRLMLHRWVRVLIEEGQDAKTFTPSEEDGLRNFAKELQTKHYQGYITPKELRLLAHMTETSSEKALSSKLLRKWTNEGHLELISSGKYKFKDPYSSYSGIAALLGQIMKSSTVSNESTVGTLLGDAQQLI